MANPEVNANDQASALNNAPSTNARAQFEAERMTRRAALRKFGFGAGMAALLALSSDDLARMAAVKLKQHAGDSRIANQIANEFKNAGVAFADSSGSGGDKGKFCEGCCGCSTIPPGYKCVTCLLWGSTLGFDCGTIGNDTQQTCCNNMKKDCLRRGGTESDCQGMWQKCNRTG